MIEGFGFVREFAIKYAHWEETMIPRGGGGT